MDNSFSHSLIFFIVATACGFGHFLDCWTTELGITNKFLEANALAVKIYNKIGNVGFFIVKCMVLPGIGAALFGTLGFSYSLAWLIPMAVIGWVAGIKNYLLLKKNKISVF